MAVKLGRQAHLETIAMTLDALEEQRLGYRELGRDFLVALQADAKQRDDEIQWSTGFCTRAMNRFDELMVESRALQTRVMERYLIRRHNTRLLKDGLEATRRICQAARDAVQEEAHVVKGKQSAEAASIQRYGCRACRRI